MEVVMSDIKDEFSIEDKRNRKKYLIKYNEQGELMLFKL